MQNNIFSELFVGQNLIVLKEVDSTNTFLKNVLSNSKPVSEGTVIMAESQYAGRGQQQNRWSSEPGKNLTFSLLLNPVFLPPVKQFCLTQVVSLGVSDAMYPLCGSKLKIKWPNDVYYENKKLGGILIENMLQGSTLKHTIAGIGLNINQEDFPDWVPNPTSLKQILHTDYDLRALLSDICRQIESRYKQLKNNEFELLLADYLSALYAFGQLRSFEAGGLRFEGTIAGVSPEGRLQVQQQGGLQEYSLKEITFLHP